MFFSLSRARCVPLPPSLPLACTLPGSPDGHLGTHTHNNTRHPSHPPYSYVFLQLYTQYIPLSVHQLKDWAGTPAIFVLDCSAAGVLLRHFVEPQLAMEEGDDVINPDTPPRGDGSGVGGGAGGAASDMSESLRLFFYFILFFYCV